MLPKIHRFSPRIEVPNFFQSARKISSRSFVVVYSKTNTKYWRATVIVPKKVSTLAVCRNAIKRKVRAQIQSYFSQKNPEIAFAVVIKPAILNRDSNGVNLELQNVLSQLT